jgi:hypothetical protein
MRFVALNEIIMAPTILIMIFRLEFELKININVSNEIKQKILAVNVVYLFHSSITDLFVYAINQDVIHTIVSCSMS